MSAIVLSGKECAAALRKEVAATAAAVTQAAARPRLAIVVASADESIAWYVRSIARAADKVGVTCDTVDLGADASTASIRERLAQLSTDRGVHGVILQTPLPPGALLQDLASSIAPDKDVDGANPVSLGRLAVGQEAFAPATAEAVLELLEYHKVELAGREVAVIGRSAVVGKPVALLLLGRNATVTVCHSHTADLASVTARADVVVAAAGHAGLVTAAHVRPGAVIIDVGTNPTEDGGLTGDVDAPSVRERAGALTPVPGGVGPVTTALLLQHTVRAAIQQNQAR